VQIRFAPDAEVSWGPAMSLPPASSRRAQRGAWCVHERAEWIKPTSFPCGPFRRRQMTGPFDKGVISVGRKRTTGASTSTTCRFRGDTHRIVIGGEEFNLSAETLGRAGGPSSAAAAHARATLWSWRMAVMSLGRTSRASTTETRAEAVPEAGAGAPRSLWAGAGTEKSHVRGSTRARFRAGVPRADGVRRRLLRSLSS